MSTTGPNSLHDDIAADSERGRAERVAFRSVQQVAPYYPGQPLDFQQVNCCDISTSGFSFYADSKPESQFIVCRFRALTGYIQVVAEVLRTWPEETAHGLSLRVAVRFVRRLE